MPNFRSEEEILKELSGRMRLAVKDVVDEILEQNEQLIEDLVYNAYSPSVYERTGNFGDSWDTRIGGAGSYIEGEFYFKPKFNVSFEHDSDTLPQHASIDGQAVGQYMADIIYDGAMGCISRPTKRDASKALDRLLTNTYFRTMFEAAMSRHGIPWKRGAGGVSVIRRAK